MRKLLYSNVCIAAKLNYKIPVTAAIKYLVQQLRVLYRRATERKMSAQADGWLAGE